MSSHNHLGAAKESWRRLAAQISDARRGDIDAASARGRTHVPLDFRENRVLSQHCESARSISPPLDELSRWIDVLDYAPRCEASGLGQRQGLRLRPHESGASRRIPQRRSLRIQECSTEHSVGVRTAAPLEPCQQDHQGIFVPKGALIAFGLFQFTGTRVLGLLQFSELRCHRWVPTRQLLDRQVVCLVVREPQVVL